jgi:hypothetical protein
LQWSEEKPSLDCLNKQFCSYRRKKQLKVFGRTAAGYPDPRKWCLGKNNTMVKFGRMQSLN